MSGSIVIVIAFWYYVSSFIVHCRLSFHLSPNYVLYFCLFVMSSSIVFCRFRQYHRLCINCLLSLRQLSLVSLSVICCCFVMCLLSLCQLYFVPLYVIFCQSVNNLCLFVSYYWSLLSCQLCFVPLSLTYCIFVSYHLSLV